MTASPIRFLLPIAAAALATAIGARADAQTKVWTVDADFDSGKLDNVAHVPSDQLVLGRTPVSKTTLVWATNYLYGYVVRIDSTNGKQTSRFDSALTSINGQPTGAKPANEYCNFSNTGNCPGRVAVDTNGDVWIINRAFSGQGTLSKFSGDKAHCIDRNNNGVIDTSYDKNGDGVIDVNPAAGEYFGQNDECILATIKVGPNNALPRAVAIDKRGKVWACTHNEGKCYRYNPNEPVALEATVTVGGSPYSAATGGDYLFVSSSGSGGTKRVHIDTLAVDSVNCPSTYGVVADPNGNRAWLGGYFAGDGFYTADFVNKTCTKTGTGGCITAMTLDLDGNVWAANYCNHTVHKATPGGALIGTYSAGGQTPHGLSVDFQGNIWVINHGPPSVAKINSQTGALIGTYTIGGPGVPNADPYLYSDFTGVQVDRQAPYTYVGSWSGVFDGGVPAIPWSKIAWNKEPEGAVPAETSLAVSARAADSMAALGVAAYAPVTNGAALSGVKGRYVQVRIEMKGPGFKTPVLSDIAVTGPCDPISEACCVTDADCDDGKPCTLDQCPVPGGACTHGPKPDCCETDDDCDDDNLCTTDACPAPGGKCQHSKQADCCNSSADCEDGDTCTADVCPKPGSKCSFVPINGCCITDDDCTKGNECSDAKCVGGFCQDAKKPNCCKTDADCADNDLCTIDTCDLSTGTCTNTDQDGCCNVDGECNDGDDCTVDTCSGPGGVCVFTSQPDCCTPNDPKIGTPCEEPVSPNDHPPCAPGKLVCENGLFECEGAVGPEIEICNGVDDDCDGLVDEAGCGPGTVCINGYCAEPCGQGEFKCPGGFQCFDGYCVPTDCALVTCKEGETCQNGLCISPDGGAPSGAGGGPSGGATGAGGDVAAASSGATGGASASSGASSSDASGSGDATSGATTAPAGDGGKAFGLSTGGGGCRCAVPGGDSPTEAGGSAGRFGAAVAAALAAWARRRRSGRPRAVAPKASRSS